MLAVSLYQENEWAVNPDGLKLLNYLGGTIENKQSATEQMRKLKPEWNKLVYSDEKAQHGKIEKLIAEGTRGFIRSDKCENYFFQMKSVISKCNKSKLGDKVTFHLEKGFDQKKNKSVMNAVNIKVIAWLEIKENFHRNFSSNIEMKGVNLDSIYKKVDVLRHKAWVCILWVVI